MRLSKTLILAVPLTALAIAGCGGGDDDSNETTAATTTEATALSKAELIARGDAICAEVNAAVGSVAGSGAEVPEQIVQVSDLYTGMVESIKDLGEPEEAAGYAEFAAAADELSRVEGEVKLATEREDTAAIGEAASEAGPILEEFEEAAGEYGFEECSDEPTAPTSSSTSSGAVEEESEEGGVEVAPEEVEEEAPVEEEAAPEEAAPETGGAGGGVEEAAPESSGGESGGSSGGVGPG